jgi:hypothetical protein
MTVPKNETANHRCKSFEIRQRTLFADVLMRAFAQKWETFRTPNVWQTFGLSLNARQNTQLA